MDSQIIDHQEKYFLTKGNEYVHIEYELDCDSDEYEIDYIYYTPHISVATSFLNKADAQNMINILSDPKNLKRYGPFTYTEIIKVSIEYRQISI